MGKKAEEYGDFTMYYDSTQKRNIWLMGYFGGGAVNIVNAMEIAKEYAEEANVPLESVQIDEITKSTRVKYFKFFYSHKKQEPIGGARIFENVFEILQ